MMDIICPHCQQTLEGDDSLVGEIVDCPNCGQSFVVSGTKNETEATKEPIVIVKDCGEKQIADNERDEGITMKEFTFSCPVCGCTLAAAPDMSGMVLDCPSCKKPINVPNPDKRDENVDPDFPNRTKNLKFSVVKNSPWFTRNRKPVALISIIGILLSVIAGKTILSVAKQSTQRNGSLVEFEETAPTTNEEMAPLIDRDIGINLPMHEVFEQDSSWITTREDDSIAKMIPTRDHTCVVYRLPDEKAASQIQFEFRSFSRETGRSIQNNELIEALVWFRFFIFDSSGERDACDVSFRSRKSFLSLSSSSYARTHDAEIQCDIQNLHGNPGPWIPVKISLEPKEIVVSINQNSYRFPTEGKMEFLRRIYILNTGLEMEIKNIRVVPATNMVSAVALFDQGRALMGKDDAKAVEYLQRAAGMGHREAREILSALYAAGIGCNQSYVEAFKWAEKASEQDSPNGKWLLGMMYQSGKGVEKNDKSAYDHFKWAAEHGVAEAQVRCGLMCYSGKQNEFDYGNRDELAKKWLEKAVNNQNLLETESLASAYYALGLIECASDSIPYDYESAKLHFQAAAHLGHKLAAELLANNAEKFILLRGYRLRMQRDAGSGLYRDEERPPLDSLDFLLPLQ